MIIFAFQVPTLKLYIKDDISFGTSESKRGILLVRARGFARRTFEGGLAAALERGRTAEKSRKSTEILKTV